MSQTDASKYDRQMGFTEREFEKTLKGGFTGESSVYHCFDVCKNQWRIEHADDSLNIKIEVQKRPERRIGALSIPVLQVAFTVTDTEESTAEAFFNKFFKYFHKGGG